MRHNKFKIIFVILIVAVIVIFVFYKFRNAKGNGETVKEIKPAIGNIQNTISATGSVLPKNRLEIKPPVNGRIEEILVKEGERIKIGQTLAWMSSTERAALLDAARGEGEEALLYWKDVYKAIPLIAPIGGEVIVAKTQPGQTITTSEAVIVISDQLIIRAQVDETDIGKIKLDQSAVIALDAYPEIKINSKVGHIYYESKTVNNVTVYEVDLIPESIPEILRSGMNATVDFIENSKIDVLLLPADAVIKEKDKAYCLVKQSDNPEPIRQEIEIGLSDDKNVEVISGLNSNDTVVVRSKKYMLPKSDSAKNPFMPSRRR